MVRLSFQDNSIIFTFEDSSHYLQGNGVIEAPKGSLALTTDESNMANFVKASSNDIFVSATYEELGMTKAQLLETFAANAGSSGGGGGLTPEEAQEMIDESISGKADTSAVTQALTEKVDVSAYTAYTSATDSAIASKASNTDLQSVSGVVDTKLATNDFNTYSSATDSAIASKADASALTDYVEVSTYTSYTSSTDATIASKASQSDLESVSGDVATKLATSDFNTYSGNVDTAIASKASNTDLQSVSGAVDTKLATSDFNTYSASVDTAIASKADTTAMTQALSTKQDTLVSGTNVKTINNTSILGSGNIEIQVEVDDELDIDSPNAVANSAITKAIQDNELVAANALIVLQEDLDDKVDVSAYTAYTSATDTAIASKASQTDLQSVSAATASNTTALGGYKLWKGTQTEYDNLSVKDASTIYFIVD